MIHPGDARIFEQAGGTAVVLRVALWAEERNTWIQIHLSGHQSGKGDGQTTVTNNPESPFYHRTLFRDLRRTLIQQDCWNFGEKGVETEEEETPSRFKPVPIRGKPLSATIIEDRVER